MTEKIHGVVVILGSPNDAAGDLSQMGRGRVRLGFKTYRRLAAQDYRLLLTGGYGSTSIQHLPPTRAMPKDCCWI